MDINFFLPSRYNPATLKYEPEMYTNLTHNIYRNINEEATLEEHLRNVETSLNEIRGETNDVIVDLEVVTNASNNAVEVANEALLIANAAKATGESAQATSELAIEIANSAKTIALAVQDALAAITPNVLIIQSATPLGDANRLWVNPDNSVVHYWNGSNWMPTVGIWG